MKGTSAYDAASPSWSRIFGGTSKRGWFQSVSATQAGMSSGGSRLVREARSIGPGRQSRTRPGIPASQKSESAMSQGVLTRAP
jgi:hypothetical protein